MVETFHITSGDIAGRIYASVAAADTPPQSWGDATSGLGSMAEVSLDDFRIKALPAAVS